MNKVPNQRQGHLDSLRGGAAVCVVFAHYIGAFYPSVIFGGPTGPQKDYLQEFFLIPPFGILVSGRFAVNFFFVLSGYVLAWGGLGREFSFSRISGKLIGRPIRLGGLLIVVVLVSYLVWICGGYYNKQVAQLRVGDPWFSGFWTSCPSFSQFLWDLLFVFTNGPTYNSPLWTIKRELVGSFFVFLLVGFVGWYKYRLRIFALLFIISWGDWIIPRTFLPFIAGCLIAELHKHHLWYSIFAGRKVVQWILFVLAIGLGSIPYYMESTRLELTIWKILPSLPSLSKNMNLVWSSRTLFGLELSNVSAILFMVWATSATNWKILHSKVGLFLGRVSYSVYAIHFVILGSFSAFLFIFFQKYLNYNISFSIVLVLGFFLTFILSYLLTRFIDEPVIKLSSQISGRVVRLVEKWELHLHQIVRKIFSLSKGS